MPSGKTHDLVTVALSPAPLAAAGAAELFGGLMFGPDLDIQSRQYTRWGVFRFLWLPYKTVFRHRSRWSHGIIFGTLIRVVYFAAALTLLFWVCVYARALLLAGGAPPGRGGAPRGGGAGGG